MTNPPNLVPFWLDTQPVIFPPSNLAMVEPDGLLAVGGDLTPEWLLMAYSKGIFPWFNPGEPILWWTPNPRSVLFIEELKIRRSLRKNLNKYLKTGKFLVTFDKDFEAVMRSCAAIPREDQDGTWISEEMVGAYKSLHKAGHAHSVEVWYENKLVGGLYGVAIGKMFFGESMFSTLTDSSKIALIALGLQLHQWGFSVIDSQVETQHLNSLGAQQINREDFEALIKKQTSQPFLAHKWQLDNQWQEWVKPHLENQNP